MTAPTHYAFSYLVCTAAGVPPSIALPASLLSLLPDIDHPESFAGRLFPTLSRKILQKHGHRTVTHSLFAVLVISIALFPLLILSHLSPFSKGGAGGGSWCSVYAALLLSYSSHIFIDLFNRAGVKLLAPVSQKEYISFQTPALRIMVRSWQEYLLLFIIVFMAFSITGETFSIHKGMRAASKLIYRHYDGALTDYENSSKNICTAKIEYFDAVQSKVMKEQFIVLTMFPENVYLLRIDSPLLGKEKGQGVRIENRIILKKDTINEITVEDTKIPRSQYKVSSSTSGERSRTTLRDLAALPADTILSGTIILKNYQPVLRNSDYIRVSHSPTATTITLICAMTGELGEIIALEKMRNAELKTLKAKQSSFQISRLTAEKTRLESNIRTLSAQGLYANYDKVMTMNSEVKKIDSRIDSLRLREVSGADADTTAKIETMENDYSVEYDIWITEL